MKARKGQWPQCFGLKLSIGIDSYQYPVAIMEKLHRTLKKRVEWSGKRRSTIAIFKYLRPSIFKNNKDLLFVKNR